MSLRLNPDNRTISQLLNSFMVTDTTAKPADTSAGRPVSSPITAAEDQRPEAKPFSGEVRQLIPAKEAVPGAITANALRGRNVSIETLAADGTFAPSDLRVEKPLSDGKNSPLIKVGFQNHSGTGTMRPDFIIKQDGSVQIVGDPSRKLRQNDISIQVERSVGQLRPSAAQQAAVDELSGYLAGRVKEQYPKDIKYGVKLSDTQNLVSADAEKAMGARNASELGRLPEITRRQVEDLNRFDGGGRGRMTRREADQYFPRRDGTAPSETERLAAMKDVVAGFATRRVKNPYENIGYRPERGRTIGRYGLGYDQISEWLESKTTQDFQSLERLGQIPKGAADRLSRLKQSVEMHKADPNAQLDPFLEKLKNPQRGVPLTKAELRESFGKEVQELAATDMVRKYAWETLQKDGAVDVGKVALAMQLGHAPSEAELKRGENRALMRAANQSYSLADSRHRTPGNQDIDWTDVNGRTLATARNAIGRVMWGDFASVVQGGRLGCAASVSKVLEQAGIYGIKSAGVKDFAHRAQARGYQRLPLSEARPGDIVYGLEPGTAQVGGRAHIGIVGTNGLVYHNRSGTGRWSEDNLSRVFNGRRFGRNLYVLRAPQSRT